MKIGVGSPRFCLSPFAQMAEEISKEFRLWEILSEGEDRLQAVANEVREARESFGLEYQVHAPLSDVNIGSMHEPMRLAAVKEIKDTIDMCHRLDISLLTVHPGFVNGIAFLDRRRALEMTRASLRELDLAAKRSSVEIAVENLPANINATCTSADELLKAIDGTDLGVCFDLGHANTAGQVEAMLKLVDRFRNVHLHNNEGQWDQHNVVDDGTADIGVVVKELKRAYRGNIIIESTDLAAGVESRRKLEELLG